MSGGNDSSNTRSSLRRAMQASCCCLPTCFPHAFLPPCLVPFHLFGARFTPLPAQILMPTKYCKLTLE